MGEPLKQKVGDAEAALAAAPHKVDVVVHDAPPPPRSDRAARLHPRLGGRHAADPRRLAGGGARSLDHRGSVRAEREPGAPHFALRGRRLRQQASLAAPDPCGRGGEARKPAGADHAFARGGVPDRRRPHLDRAARGARRESRWDARRRDPYGRRRDDSAQQHARTLHPADEERLRVEDLLVGRRDGADEHDRQHLHARAGRGGRHVRPRIRDGRTCRSNSAWIRSSCASGTSPRRTR